MLAIFGFIMAIAYGSPWWVFVIGALCLFMDASTQQDRRRR